MSEKLNLGCGAFKKENYINLDFCAHFKPDIIHDLNEFPYPLEDNKFELVEADHVLEHLHKPFMAMREIHRIAKNGALIIIKVPHFSRGFMHPDHKSGFDISFAYRFNSSIKQVYQGFEFEVKKIKMTWFAQPYLKKKIFSKAVFCGAYIMGSIIDFFAGLSPIICSRIWSFWVGGFEEIEFHFIVRK